MNISPRTTLASGAQEMGISLDEHQLDQFDALTELLLEWNSKFNLTRITDRVEIAVKHYLDSISLLAYLKMKKDASVIDVGTGAGLPGVPLKILNPDIKLTLLDSVQKKLSFAEAAAQELGLSDVSLIHARAEDAGREKANRERFDTVVSRAVSRLTVLSELCLPFCKVGGEFAAYKGPDVDDEASEAGRAIKLLGGKLEGIHRFTLPSSDLQRTILLIRKVRHTPSSYPRKAGIPARDPVMSN